MNRSEEAPVVRLRKRWLSLPHVAPAERPQKYPRPEAESTRIHRDTYRFHDRQLLDAGRFPSGNLPFLLVGTKVSMSDVNACETLERGIAVCSGRGSDGPPTKTISKPSGNDAPSFANTGPLFPTSLQNSLLAPLRAAQSAVSALLIELL